MDKDFAQKRMNELVADMRNHRVFLIIDSKSHDYTCYFQVCSIDPKGQGFDYMALMNFLGIKAWKNRLGVQEGNITKCAGRFAYYVWDNIRINAKAKGLELPDDFDKLIQHIPSF